MSNTDSLQILFQLGEIHPDQQWLDYTSHGISAADTPALLALVSNEDLHKADVDSDEVWVPQHAWRALGQVGNAACIKPLLSLLDAVLMDDVWVAQELPLVMGMIGQEAIGDFSQYIQDTSHSEGARIICAEGMKCVVEQASHSRDVIVKALSLYLATPDNNAPELNGIVVCCLLDLKASESIEVIRAVYENGTIDVSYAGDIEDVEIDLGLRAERETPSTTQVRAQDSYQHDTSIESPGNDVDEDITHCLTTYSSNNAVKNIYELDGFFSALGCAPESITPEQWLASIWGGEAYAPKWIDQEESDKFVSAVMVTYNRVVQALNTDTYSALFEEKRTDGKRHVVADDWCNGFLRGINMWGHLNAVDALFLKENMQPIRLFATESGRDRLKVMNEGGIDYQQRKIEKNVRHMYQHWMTQRQSMNAPVLNTDPKIGRNDPCPCGSGKKFKKCCLH
ncbi:UPF0149 family protein [Pseudomonadota bacterium]